MQGLCTTVVQSESVPPGTSMEFIFASAVDTVSIGTARVKVKDLISQVMDYGIFHGFGQWRNSGKGRFNWKFVEDPAKA